MRKWIGDLSLMHKSTIIGKLREHEAELKASGVEHLSLFGSYARDTAVPAVSDVDLLADFDGSKRLTLFSLSGLRLQITGHSEYAGRSRRPPDA
jgi:predicted nucleotidyltransferase